MSNQVVTVAKRTASGQTEYTCPVCGGYDGLGVYALFLPLVDHLIGDLCVIEHPMLSNHLFVEGQTWFRVPSTNKLIPGLPPYGPDAPEWRELLGRNKKILPQAEIFLVDIGDWLEAALKSLEALNDIKVSDIMTAESLISLIRSLGEEFQEQRDYLLRHSASLEDTGTDPKWLARPGNQARFVADSMAGARWHLTSSSSREMIRKTPLPVRQEGFRLLRIQLSDFWWRAPQGTFNF
jgi:hypothetical protein